MERVDNAATQGKKRSQCPRCGKIAAHFELQQVNIKREHNGPSGECSIKSEDIRTTDGRIISVVPPSQMKQRSSGDDYNGVQPKLNGWSCRWLRRCDRVGRVTPSTKTKAALDQVKQWQAEAPDDKIVIFNEWIATARVLGRMLNESKIDFVYYNGEISTQARTKNLDDFRTNPSIKVMVC
jgi:SNF2 family DNA or RNA helicase